jgi:hypothetical protein
MKTELLNNAKALFSEIRVQTPCCKPALVYGAVPVTAARSPAVGNSSQDGRARIFSGPVHRIPAISGPHTVSGTDSGSVADQYPGGDTLDILLQPFDRRPDVLFRLPGWRRDIEDPRTTLCFRVFPELGNRVFRRDLATIAIGLRPARRNFCAARLRHTGSCMAFVNCRLQVQKTEHPQLIPTGLIRS